jgi:hypothetical protein
MNIPTAQVYRIDDFSWRTSADRLAAVPADVVAQS